MKRRDAAQTYSAQHTGDLSLQRLAEAVTNPLEEDQLLFNFFRKTVVVDFLKDLAIREEKVATLRHRYIGTRWF